MWFLPVSFVTPRTGHFVPIVMSCSVIEKGMPAFLALWLASESKTRAGWLFRYARSHSPLSFRFLASYLSAPLTAPEEQADHAVVSEIRPGVFDAFVVHGRVALDLLSQEIAETTDLVLRSHHDP